MANTSGVSRSSFDWLNSTGFPEDLCVVFFIGPPGNKAKLPTPSWRKKAVMFATVKINQDQLNFNKTFCEVCSFTPLNIGWLHQLQRYIYYFYAVMLLRLADYTLHFLVRLAWPMYVAILKPMWKFSNFILSFLFNFYSGVTIALCMWEKDQVQSYSSPLLM